MFSIDRADVGDIEGLVSLETKLFVEDAGVHDAFVDVTWPAREGHADFNRLLSNPDALVLIARELDTIVGHLVAYTAKSSPTRRAAKFAELRSLYVEKEWRRRGVGQQLVRAFVDWARNERCDAAHVDSYAANHAAERFYASVGFTSASVTRALQL